MTTNELIVIANFLGDEITESQVNRLMDEVRKTSANSVVILGIRRSKWLK